MEMSDAIWRNLERGPGRSGRSHGQVVEDFLRVCHSVACIEPQEIREHGHTPAGQQLQQEIIQKYGMNSMRVMAQCAGMWQLYCRTCQLTARGHSIDANHELWGQEGWDVLGRLYMKYGHTSKQSGQFFTPWSVCFMMASITDANDLLTHRMHAYFEDNPGAADLWQAQMAAATIGGMAQGGDPRLHYHLHLAEQATKIFKGFDPISHCDPCIGSGRTMLAAASTYPTWAVWSGMVTFFGCDIDYRCVRMSRSNMAAFGCKSKLLDWDALEEPQKEGIREMMSPQVMEMYRELEQVADREARSRMRLSWQDAMENEGQQTLISKEDLAS